jgi:hypothetical protein
VVGYATPAQSNSQTTVYEMGRRVTHFDLSETIRSFWMTESGGVRQVIAKDPRDSARANRFIEQRLHGEAELFAPGDGFYPASFCCVDTPGIEKLAASAAQVEAQWTPLPSGGEIAFTTNENMTHMRFARQDSYDESRQPIHPGMGLSAGTSLIGDQTLSSSHNSSLFEELGSDRGYTSLNEEKTFSNPGQKESGHTSQDWKGIGRDTGYYVGYQVVVCGALYLTPESVSKWTPEQKRSTVNDWTDNVQSAHWDHDQWWINYVGHPYWGAAFYIRARERGLGEFGSFGYSALLSALYEYGIEAFFEQPSYQDLIVTPVAGALIGKFIFEPIRGSIKAKTELAWSDHLLLVLTDPLGAANNLVDRTLGIKSTVRVVGPGAPFLLPDRSSYHTARSLKRQDEDGLHRPAVGIRLDLVW